MCTIERRSQTLYESHSAYRLALNHSTCCSSLPSDVEFVLAPQHETSCDPETTAKEDFAYWKRITEESNLEVYRRIHDKSNEVED